MTTLEVASLPGAFIGTVPDGAVRAYLAKIGQQQCVDGLWSVKDGQSAVSRNLPILQKVIIQVVVTPDRDPRYVDIECLTFSGAIGTKRPVERSFLPTYLEHLGYTLLELEWRQAP